MPDETPTITEPAPPIEPSAEELTRQRIVELEAQIDAHAACIEEHKTSLDAHKEDHAAMKAMLATLIDAPETRGYINAGWKQVARDVITILNH